MARRSPFKGARYCQANLHCVVWDTSNFLLPWAISFCRGHVRLRQGIHASRNAATTG